MLTVNVVGLILVVVIGWWILLYRLNATQLANINIVVLTKNSIHTFTNKHIF
jgi:predicted MPP superfamily phosphohydrolase